MNDVEVAEKLIVEIKQIRQQYNHEVGSKGKPWPKSIKDRVFQLIEMGFTLQSISDDTEIPYYSILNWRHRGKEKAKFEQFQELAVRSVVTGTATVAESSQSFIQKPAPVTVTTPGGYRIEAIDVTDVLKILKAMRGGG
jgi:hypothetical protein